VQHRIHYKKKKKKKRHAKNFGNSNTQLVKKPGKHK
jgi:hypothetical protein